MRHLGLDQAVEEAHIPGVEECLDPVDGHQIDVALPQFAGDHHALDGRQRRTAGLFRQCDAAQHHAIDAHHLGLGHGEMTGQAAAEAALDQQAELVGVQRPPHRSRQATDDE